MPLPTHSALRYVTPLREGGSLPALVETDGGMTVVKFRGAGQGARALVAELIVGGLARHLGLPLPPLALVDLGDGFGRAEPDPEIQDILRASRGLNVGLGFVPGAFAYDPVAHSGLVSPDLAAEVVWLDALTTNIDRTARNTNLLMARGDDGAELWLIDHGAALYFHHDWARVTPERAQAAFPAIQDHVLLPRASSIAEADSRLAGLVTPDAITDLLSEVPDGLLTAVAPGQSPDFDSAQDARDAYAGYLRHRLRSPRAWVETAEAARQHAPEVSALSYRR